MSTLRNATSALPAAGRAEWLTADGALQLQVEPELLHLVRGWLPRFPSPASARTRAAAAAWIGVVRSDDRSERPASPCTLRLDTADAWIDAGAETVSLCGSAAGCHGHIDLVARRAELRVPPATRAGAEADLYSLLTLSAALLLGRLGRTLVHAAGAVDPACGAWLLIGDTHSGKSTTCANLSRAGWDYLSDDQLILFAGSTNGQLWVEGWPRAFQLDAGWRDGTSIGTRRAVPAAWLRPGRRRRTARLAGLLFPSVQASLPTVLTTLSGSEALGRLIRQTPWLLADRRAAVSLLELLQRSVEQPAFELRLGLDTYDHPELLRQRLSAELESK